MSLHSFIILFFFEWGVINVWTLQKVLLMLPGLTPSLYGVDNKFALRIRNQSRLGKIYIRSGCLLLNALFWGSQHFLNFFH